MRRTALLFTGLGLFLATSLDLPGHDGESRHGRSSKLSPPEGAANLEARGRVLLSGTTLAVLVEHLAAGDYSVLLDDGTGTKVEIGKITVAALEDDGDDEDDSDDGGNGEGDPAGGGAGDHGESDHRRHGGSGMLSLSDEALPFGAASSADLGGRAICVSAADGAVVLSGTTPSPMVHEPEPHLGHCELSRPDPAVDADAEGALKLEQGEGRVVIKVHLRKLEPAKVYEVVVTNIGGDASESIGKVTTNEDGNGHFKLDSEKGDAIPFGAGNLAALEGFGVTVKDEAGAAVLVGKICPARPERDDDEHEDEDHGARCFSAALDGAQEVPPVETAGKGTARLELKEHGTILRYEVKVEGLSGAATAAHIHTGASGVPGDVLIPLDAATLAGEVEVTAEQVAALRSGDTYVNVHTEANSGGEVRGQITACERHNDDEDDDEHEDGHPGGNDGRDGDHDGDPDGMHEGGGGAVVEEEPIFLMIGAFDTPFLRGDANSDERVDLSDAVFTLNYLFAGGARPFCLDSADPNDDGRVDVTDPIAMLAFLFQGGPPPSSPGILIPGSDSTADGLYCEEPGA